MAILLLLFTASVIIRLPYLNCPLGGHQWLTAYNFKTIIDIGANEGQFAHKMRKLFPDAQIISFEPLPLVYKKLTDSFIKDQKFSSYNIALGENEENAVMWLNEYSPSSSLLKMKQHIDHFNFARSQSAVNVKVVPLDQVLELSKIELPYLVKIDVQGFEEFVIKGGRNIISNATMVIAEVSFIQLYDGHLLYDGIYFLMKELGFRYAGNYLQLRSPVNNEILQADAIFLK